MENPNIQKNLNSIGWLKLEGCEAVGWGMCAVSLEAPPGNGTPQHTEWKPLKRSLKTKIKFYLT